MCVICVARMCAGACHTDVAYPPFRSPPAKKCPIIVALQASLGCRKWGCNKWGFKGCLAALPGNRPKSAFSALFLPFLPFSGRCSSHLPEIQKTEEKGLFPQVSSDLLEPPSLKPPFAALQLLFCFFLFSDSGRAVPSLFLPSSTAHAANDCKKAWPDRAQRSPQPVSQLAYSRGDRGPQHPESRKQRVLFLPSKKYGSFKFSAYTLWINFSSDFEFI